MRALTLKELNFKTGINIVRLAPNSNSAEIEFITNGKGNILIVLQKDGKTIPAEYSFVNSNTLKISGLENGVLYTVFLKDGELVSPVRLFCCGYVPGTVVNYIHPDDFTYNISGRSPATPCIIRLSDGKLLASHDVYWCDGGQNLTLIFASEDNGTTWHYRSYVFPCFWGKLFEYRGKVYIIGVSYEYGTLQIFSSVDEGKNWSKPCEILPAGNKYIGGPHKSAMPVIECNGRLWTGIDYGSWDIGGHATGAVSVGIDDDLMNPGSWISTGFLKYDSNWDGAVKGKSSGFLEGNIVELPDGELYNIIRYQTNECIPEYGKAGVLRYDKNNPSAMPEFYKIIDFEGNLSKFTVLKNPKNNKYYSLVNRVISKNIGQRNVLSLMESENGIDWKLKRDILNFQDNGWHEDFTKAAFQYIDFIFDDDDIFFLSRTALNNAYSFHNANYITFHRIISFTK